MPLTDSPASLVRSLKGAPLACLFIMLLSGDALRAGELCQATGYSPNSITAALRLLSYLHLTAKAPDGWCVPADQRRHLLHGVGVPEAGAIRDLPTSICESSPSGGEAINKEYLYDSSPPPVTSKSQIDGAFSEAWLGLARGQNLPSSDLREVPGVQIERLSRGTFCQPSATSQQQIARILDATRLLFNERVHGPPARYPDLRLLLAAIAEAYTRRSSLRTPARVAYANLKRGVDPGVEFLADPLAYLPDEFLVAAGLSSQPVADDQGEVDGMPPKPDTAGEPLPATHPSLGFPADDSARRSAAQVWETAVQELSCELNRSVYRRYVEPCRLAAFEPETCVFIVKAGDDQACMWLQDRLTSRLTRLLRGICDRSCNVRFVVEP